MTMETEELDYSDEDPNNKALNTDEENSLLGMSEEAGNRNEGDDPYLELDCPDDYDQEEENTSLNATNSDRNDSRSENSKDNQNRDLQRNRGRQFNLMGNQTPDNRNNNNNNNGRPSRDRNRNKKSKLRQFRSRSKSLHGQNHSGKFPARKHSPVCANKTFTQSPWIAQGEPKFMQGSTDQPNATIFPTQNLQQAIHAAHIIGQPPGLMNGLNQRSQEPIQSISRNQIPINQYSTSNLPSLMGNAVTLASQEYTTRGRNSGIAMNPNNNFSITRTVSVAGNNRQIPPCPPLIEGSLMPNLLNVNQKLSNFNNFSTFRNGQNENRNLMYSRSQENSPLEHYPRGNTSTSTFLTRNVNASYRSNFLGSVEVKNENSHRNSFGSSSYQQAMPNLQISRSTFTTSNPSMNKAGQSQIPWTTRFNINANKNNQNNNSNISNTNQTNYKYKNRSEPLQNKNNSYRDSSFSGANNVSANKNRSPKENNQIPDSETNFNIERGRPERPKTPRSTSRGRSQDGRKTPIPIPEITPLDKELVNQKKAERLQRFSSNNAPLGGGSETSSHAGSLDWSIDQGCLNTSLEIDESYLRGMEEQKRKREEVMKQKLMKRKMSEDSTVSASAEPCTAKKPNMTQRESIFNKKNPFETDLEVPLDVDIKKEEDENAKKAKKFANKSNLNSSFSRDNVTFTRTISKSMEELGLIKSRPGTPARASALTPTSAPARTVTNRAKSPHPRKCQTPKPVEVPPMVVEKTIVNEYAIAPRPERGGNAYVPPVPESQSPVFGNSQAPESSVLNGCIVKIMNIPTTLSHDDVFRMCAPFGKALEIKLNFPKENSAAVRFSNPSSAESFFNRYHGEKFENLFLHLVVI